MENIIELLRKRTEQFSEFFKGFLHPEPRSSNNTINPKDFTTPSVTPRVVQTDEVYDDTGTFRKNQDQLWNWNWDEGNTTSNASNSPLQKHEDHVLVP